MDARTLRARSLRAVAVLAAVAGLSALLLLAQQWQALDAAERALEQQNKRAAPKKALAEKGPSIHDGRERLQRS